MFDVRDESTQQRRTLNRVIAVTGCDGSGKSTLTADLLRNAQDHGRARLVYLGQSSGNIKQAIARLPLIGPGVARFLENKASRMHGAESGAVHGATALVIYLLSCWRAHKLRRVVRLCRQGTVVITDRYPQAEIPGFPVDGAGLAAKTTKGWLARRLAERELRLYEWMAGYLPALVIRLNVDADTAHARKPDHGLAMLRQKCALIPMLHFNGAHILDVDARLPYATVLDAALKAATDVLRSADDGAAPDRTAPAATPGRAGEPTPVVVAVVGCDGTGKSSLTNDLTAHFARTQPTVRRYLGLVSGEVGEKIRHIPLVGHRLEPHLARKAALAQDMRRELPGLGTALVMYMLSRWRAFHFQRTLRLARRGILVITDRYPQAEIPGFRYDGPGLGAQRGQSGLLQWLVHSEQLVYNRMASCLPQLVIRLAIDAETALARKPDHAAAELRDKIEVMAKLHYNGACIIDIDSRQPYAEVLRRTIAAIESAVPSSAMNHPVCSAPAHDCVSTGARQRPCK